MRNLANNLFLRLMIAGVAWCLSATATLAYDVWGDNGSTGVGGGTNNSAGNPNQPSNSNANKNNQGTVPTDDVDLYTGQLVLSVTDVEIRGRMPLKVQRFYRSGSAFQGMFGRGWNMEYNERLFILATNGNLLLRSANTARDEFVNRGDNTFAPPAGRYDTLARNGDGSYTLREKHGTIRNYNLEGCLTEIRDRNGNQLLFTYQPGGKLPINAVSDYSHYTNAILVARDYRLARMEVAYGNVPSGRFIQFLYDANGRVTHVTDFTGRSWRYDYDFGGRGALLGVTTPPVSGFTNGLTTRYAYAATNYYRLTTITDPSGQTYLTNFYDAAGRVIKQFWGTATYSFGYPSNLIAIVTNGNGFRTERSFDTNGNVLNRKEYTAGLRSTDPGAFLTRYAYNANNDQAQVIYPAGNQEVRRHDAYGNLVELRRNDNTVLNTNTWRQVQGKATLEVYLNIGGGTAVSDLLNSQKYRDHQPDQILSISTLESPISGDAYGQKMYGWIVAPETGNYTFWLASDDQGQFWLSSDASPANLGTSPKITVSPWTTFRNWNGYKSAPILLVAGKSYYFEAYMKEGSGSDSLAIAWRKPSDTTDPKNGDGSMIVGAREQSFVNWINPAEVSFNYTYDPYFNFLKTITDPRGNITTNIYDYEIPILAKTNGNIAQIVYPAVEGTNPIVSFGYTSFGQVSSMTNAASTVTKFTYDDTTGYLLQRIEAFKTALAATNTYSYDNRGNILTATDARGNMTTYQYDPLDRLTSITSAVPFNYVTRYSYNANGKLARLERQTGDAGHPWQTTTYGYDILDRLKAATNDLGQVTQYSYDGNGNRTLVTDANGNSTSYSYDERNLLWKVTDAMTNTVRYTYNLNAGLAQLIDARSNVTAYAYDAIDRLTKTTYPDTSSENYVYDPAGNLVAKRSRAGTWITNNFDALNRRTAKLYADSSAIAYRYDFRGLLISTADTNGTMTFNYDARGRLISSTNTSGQRVAYEYDATGSRTKLIYPDSSFVTYAYDNLNRLASITDSGATVVASFVYDALNRRTQLTYGNGTRTAYAYNWANNLTNLIHIAINSGATLGSFSYTYDNVGNRLTLATVAIPYPGTHSYAYDKTYQLTSVAYPSGYPFPGMSYSYDAAGNRTKTINGGTIIYSANNLNQYNSVGGTAYSYSAKGNLASDGTFTFNYDEDNRLVKAAKSGSLFTYVYDGLGRRIQKNVNGVVRRFVYAGDQVITESDGSGNLLVKNVFGTSIDELLRTDIGANRYYSHADGLGSMLILTDASGVKVESYTYDASGQVLSVVSGVGNRRLFTGREYDQETGLYYYRTRHYNSTLGRFNQHDPMADYMWLRQQDKAYLQWLLAIRSKTGRDLRGQLYSYCGNNPIIYNDPFGLKRGDWWDPKSYLPDYNKANDIANEERKHHQGRNDADDAMRHADWSKRMYEEINPFTSWSAGWGHEIEQMFQGSQPWDEFYMDIHNNAVGREAGEKHQPIDLRKLQTSPK